MPIAVLAVALVAYLYALVAAPAFRPWGLALGAAAALAVGVYLWRSEPEAARVGARIEAGELTLDQLSLDRAGRGATLTGRVLNGSEAFRLREMTMVLRLRDCPDGKTDSTLCPIIGEAEAVARPDAPPGQIRAFRALFSFRDPPPVAGELRWDWEVKETRATE